MLTPITACFAALLLCGPLARQEDDPAVRNVPLIDLAANEYRGFEGGLYPGGVNTPPEGHLRSALELSRSIQPLSPAGQPDPERGLIVLLSVGLSNAAHEFAEFERREDADPRRSSRLVLVNGGQAGQSSDVIVDPDRFYWRLLDNRLSALGLSPQQVQVVWLRQRRAPAYQRATNRVDGAPGGGAAGGAKGFPRSAEKLRDELEQIVQMLRARFPNLKLCYLSDRTYQGYKGHEPRAYEAGFAIKWLIEEQIEGKDALRWSSDDGPARAPLLLWGPYLWADGERPNGVGTRWLREDFEVQRPGHPSRSGEEKVAALLGDFFSSDPTTVPWFLNQGEAEHLYVDAEADAHVDARRPGENFGTSPTLLTSEDDRSAVTFLRFDLSGIRRPVLHAKLSLRNVTADDPGGSLSVSVANGEWTESGITFETAPALGPALGTIPTASRDGTRAFGLTAAVNRHDGPGLTLAVSIQDPGKSSRFLSRDSGDAPRLVVIQTPTEE